MYRSSDGTRRSTASDSMSPVVNPNAPLSSVTSPRLTTRGKTFLSGEIANLVSKRLPMETLAGLRRQATRASYPDGETAFVRYPGVVELLGLPGPK